MIQLNRLSNPGEAAAFARVEELLERIDATPLERFASSRLAMPSHGARAAMLAELEAEAERCGRRELLDDVRDRVEAALVRRFSPLGYAGRLGVYPLPIHSTSRPDEEAAVVAAVTDAVAVALLEDRLNPRTAARLSLPGRSLLGLPPLAEAEPREADGSSVPEPSADDWAEAAIGDTRIGRQPSAPSTGRVVLAWVLAFTVGPAAVLMGIVGGGIGVGLLAGAAVFAVCWLIATYER